MTEFYKIIPNYEEYQLSNFGRVRRFHKKSMNFITLKPYKGHVSLSKNGKVKCFSIAPVVRELFGKYASKFDKNIIEKPEEHWKDIKGYEGRYQISSYGRVRSFFLEKGFKYLKGNKKVSLSDGEVSLNLSIKYLMRDHFEDRRGGRPSNPLYAFDLDGKFIGRYKSTHSFKVANGTSNFCKSALTDLREGKPTVNGGMLVIREKNYTPEKIADDVKRRKRFQIKTLRHDFKIKIKNTIIITDGNFIPKGLYVGTLKDLAKREKIPNGTLKAKIHKDKNMMVKFFDGDERNLPSTKRYFHYLEFAELTKKYETKIHTKKEKS